MLPFADSFVSWTLATVVPAFVGLVLVTLLGRGVSQRYVAGFALGIFFWFFVDTIQGSSNLEVNLGFAGDPGQIAVFLLFAFGLVVFFWADKDVASPESQGRPLRMVVPLLVAIAVGIHGFGEGSAFGSTATSTSSSSLLDAFGGVSAGIAYVLHKMLEPMMVGAIYLSYSRGTHSAGRPLRDVLVLTLLFALPSLVGAIAGYFFSFDATYGFGLGTGASIYVALRLAGQASQRGEESGSGVKMAFAILVGFTLIYVAALFHS
ncbi:MAG TPA: hypothetical protein VIW22_08190 [Nitrososphaerales archaeon]